MRVNRRSLLAYLNGELLYRDEKGVCFVPDTQENADAEKALMDGQVVELEVGREVVSTLRFVYDEPRKVDEDGFPFGTMIEEEIPK